MAGPQNPSDSLEGTDWNCYDSEGGTSVFRFRENSVLSYTSAAGSFDNGRWSQDGAAVVFRMNDGFSTYTARLVTPALLEGSAENVHGLKWKFRATRIEVPE